MNLNLTKEEADVLLSLVNQSTWKGEGVELAVELKKKLTLESNAEEENTTNPGN